MLRIQPFQALRPTPARARTFSCERLDHLPLEAWSQLDARPTHGVADLMQASTPAGVIGDHLAAKALIEEPGTTMYMHRQVRGGRRISGVAALLDAASLADGSVRPTRHVCPRRREVWRRAQRRAGVQFDPVIVGFHPTETITDLLEREMNDRPLFHVLADDGATHTFWRGCRSSELIQAFAGVERGYVLEGHARAFDPAPDGMLLALMVPLASVVPHWSVLRVPGETGERMAEWLLRHGALVSEPGEPPTGWVDACVGGDGVRWFRVQLPTARLEGTAFERTDLARLRGLLGCMGAPASSGEGQLTPGEGNLAAVARLAAGGVAFVLPRPAMSEITALSDQGCLLPQGSTWFEPRIRSGLWLRRTTMQE